jgi:hypothetical protein
MTKYAKIALVGLLTIIIIRAGFCVGDESKQPTPVRLDDLLKAWNKANQNVHEVHYTIEWTTEDRVLKEKEVRRLEGFIKRRRLARVDIRDDKGKANLILLLNDKTLECYNLRNEQKGVWEIPAGFPEEYFKKGWPMGVLARAFEWNRQLLCFEFPVSEIHQRFDARLTKEDKYWAYIELIPKTNECPCDFQKMEVVLDQRSHLVRQYRSLDANGSWSICDFQKIEVNPTPPISLESISKDLPKGFKGI